MQQVEDYILKQPEVQSMVGVLGFSLLGPGPERRPRLRARSRTGTSARAPAQPAEALAGRAFGALSGIRDAFIYPL